MLNSPYMLDYLTALESEAIYIIREAASVFSKSCLLFSGGKDSIVMSHLAYRAFWPAKIPFSFLHIDTGHNFDETIEFRDYLVRELQVELIVASVEESIKRGDVIEESGVNASRNSLQSTTLMTAIREHGFDCCFGGGRRDEEKSRAKERVFSHRDAFGQWKPKNQRPELWKLLNGNKKFGENFRVFPLSNWTELDIWNYIAREKIEVPSLYYAHERDVFQRHGSLYAAHHCVPRLDNELVEKKEVRFRTIGDITCTSAVESSADSVEKIINELKHTTHSERGFRIDDKRSDSALEDRKRQGYF